MKCLEGWHDFGRAGLRGVAVVHTFVRFPCNNEKMSGFLPRI